MNPDERQAIAAGWSRDGDGWWVRPLREGDAPAGVFGFVDEDGVYCPSASAALAFDRAAAGADGPHPERDMEAGR